jgi:hypothetical protein
MPGDPTPDPVPDEATTVASAPDEPGADKPAANEPAADEPAPAAGQTARWRVVARWVVTALAALFILFVLVLPNRLLNQTFLWNFLRLPVEPLIGIAMLLAVRPKVRPWLVAAFGLGLGLLIIVKITDIGFYASLGRPFNLVLDWVLLDDAVSFLQDSVGKVVGIVAVVAIVLLAAGLVVLATLCVRRLNRTVAEHPTAATRSVVALLVAWFVMAVFNVQIHAPVQVATRNTYNLLNNRAAQVRTALQDKAAFARLAGVDAYRDVPPDQLLTALRGKDVVLSFIESYGRSAIEDPRLAPVVDPAMDDATRRLKAAGFASRSGFLTSPTVGGGSWLAHSTFLSGLWINNEQRYRTLLSSSRLTLTRCFQRADWRTASFQPGTVRPFPEVSYYGYDQVYTVDDFGYRGPKFSWSTMPDQYAMSTLQRQEYGKAGRGPLMAEVTLTSSHSPWAPVPTMVDWDALGDGAVFGPIKEAGDSPTGIWSDAGRARTAYAKSVVYSMESVISYVEKYGNDNLVLIVLGDHQPAPLITGADASRDVPITIVARDPAVLDRISSWRWQDGVNPGPDAPVWRMNEFRDRFLSTFGPGPAATAPPSPAPVR